MVDGLPTIDTDDEEQSIQDAIRQNYETLDKPKEDEQSVTIDLRDTLQAASEGPVGVENATPQWGGTPTADEVVINIEDDEAVSTNAAEGNTQRRWGGWLRR